MPNDSPIHNQLQYRFDKLKACKAARLRKRPTTPVGK
jgi:hypothetical protein